MKYEILINKIKRHATAMENCPTVLSWEASASELFQIIERDMSKASRAGVFYAFRNEIIKFVDGINNDSKISEEMKDKLLDKITQKFDRNFYPGIINIIPDKSKAKMIARLQEIHDTKTWYRAEK